MDAPIGYRGLSDLLVALQDAVADKDARIATLEALLAERAHLAADPALLALVVAAREWSEWVGFVHAGSPESRLLQAIRDALLAPDGAASEGVADG